MLLFTCSATSEGRVCVIACMQPSSVKFFIKWKGEDGANSPEREGELT